MLRLMRKDLMLNWNVLLIMLALVAGMSAYAGLGEAPVLELIGMLMVATSIFCTTMPAREDRFKAAGFTCSLPVTRSQVMRARYVLPLLLFPVVLCLIIALLWALRGFVMPRGLLEPGAILLLAGVYVIASSIFMPFTIRFGFLGLMIALVVLQVVGLALLMLASRQAAFSVARVVLGIGAALRSLDESLGKTAYYGIVSAALLGIYASSYFVSNALFRRKDL
jgi:hypothetical protein